MKYSTLIALIGCATAVQLQKYDTDLSAIESGQDPATVKPKVKDTESYHVPECEFILSEDGSECLVKQNHSCSMQQKPPTLDKCPGRALSEES